MRILPHIKSHWNWSGILAEKGDSIGLLTSLPLQPIGDNRMTGPCKMAVDASTQHLTRMHAAAVVTGKCIQLGVTHRRGVGKLLMPNLSRSFPFVPAGKIPARGSLLLLVIHAVFAVAMDSSSWTSELFLTSRQGGKGGAYGDARSFFVAVSASAWINVSLEWISCIRSFEPVNLWSNSSCLTCVPANTIDALSSYAHAWI